MNMRREAPEPSAAVFVQPTPHGHWSSNNNFGSEVSFMPDANNRQRVIKLPEWGEPAPWTVSLGIDYSENAWPSGGSRGFEVVAEVTYGSGGATQTVLIDWIQGTSFSAPMNAISIDAIYSIPFFPHGVQPSDLTLSVLLARGSTASSIPPSKSATGLDGQLFSILDANTIADPPARIPKFGKRLFVMPLSRVDNEDLLTGNNYIRFFSAPDVNGLAFAVGTIQIDQAVLLQGVLVPPYAKYVTLENVGGGITGFIEAFYNFELQL
ncbi:MAG: hypothetical protein ABI627_02390 [Polyangiaceae bacterium]